MITYADHDELETIEDAVPAGSAGAREGDMHESEITYRIERLRGEADRARLAARGRAAGSRVRRNRLRRLVGRTLIGLGELLEQPTPCPDERTGTVRA